MYLTRVMLDVENRRKMKHASHIGAIHSLIEDSFPEEKQIGIRTRKLWRIDPLGGKRYLLIVSEKMPDHNALETIGVRENIQTKDYEPFLSRLENGMTARFRVKLNPVWSSRDGKAKGERGRVVPVPDGEQKQYLLNRAEQNGFSLKEEDYDIVERGVELYRKKGQQDIYLKKAVYEGILTITDKRALERVLREGMGKKKAYGFGLMTLIPMKIL